ncbi:hypothetical protein [Microbispora sp. H11081]|uniref:hypothetical protein n=1 Tax=Microbispora sp. H11081 TaxID=2729107 RepID=UPI0014729A08|nr:hypothetical protein [Microbispora sp. H11081]
MSTTNVNLAIYEPRAEEMSLKDGTKSAAMFLTISHEHVWFALNLTGDDVQAQAAAMDRLAELAIEAAARLRALSPTRTGEVAA